MKKILKSSTKYISVYEVFIFVAALLLFSLIIFTGVYSDIQLHAKYIQDMVAETRSPPANFLYYLTVYLLALLNTETFYLSISSIVVLSMAVTAKFTVTRHFSAHFYQQRHKDHDKTATAIIIGSALLLILFSLPTDKYYLGQIPPNVWHNSTTIFLMPFAIALYWLSYLQLIQPKPSRNLLIALFCVLNILIKPSFFFVFAIAYPCMLIAHFGLNRWFWRNLPPVIIGFVVTVIMYYLIFKLSFSNLYTAQSGVAVRPFAVWSHFSSNITFSLIASLVFPLVYSVCYWKDVFKETIFQYALLAYGVALGIFIFISETGPREFHGNFFWQCVVCSYLLFLATALLWGEKIMKNGLWSWKNTIISFAFLCHVTAGVLYLTKFLLTKNYY